MSFLMINDIYSNEIDDDESSFELCEKSDGTESDSDGSIVSLERTDELNHAKHKEVSSDDDDESSFEIIQKLNKSESKSDGSLEEISEISSDDDDESSFEIIQKRDESDSDSDRSIDIRESSELPSLANLNEVSSDDDDSSFKIIKKRDESESNSARSVVIQESTDAASLAKLEEVSSDDNELSLEIVQKPDKYENDCDRSKVIQEDTGSTSLGKLNEVPSNDDKSSFEITQKRDKTESDSDQSIVIQEGSETPEQENVTVNSNFIELKSSLGAQTEPQILHSEPEESSNTDSSEEVSDIVSLNYSKDMYDYKNFPEEPSNEDERSNNKNGRENPNNQKETIDNDLCIRLHNHLFNSVTKKKEVGISSEEYIDSLCEKYSDHKQNEELLLRLNQLPLPLLPPMDWKMEDAESYPSIIAEDQENYLSDGFENDDDLIIAICNHYVGKHIDKNRFDEFTNVLSTLLPSTKTTKRKSRISSVDLTGCRCSTCVSRVVRRKIYKQKRRSQGYEFLKQNKYEHSYRWRRRSRQATRVSLLITTQLIVVPFVMLLNYFF